MTSRKAHEWVGRATTNGDDDGGRPTLRRMHSEEGVTVATDGFRLHATNEGKRFPNYKELITREIDPDEGISFLIDARYLRDALPESGENSGAVIIHVMAANKPVEVGWKGKDGQYRYAMIMPQRNWKAAKIEWRPTDYDAVAEDEAIAADEEE